MKSLRRDAEIRNVVLQPPDWRAAFGNSFHIEVDLGCGRGHYAWKRAVKHPEINMVALEMRIKWVQKLHKRAPEENLKNLRAIRCDVTEDLPILFAEGTISGFTLHHPDPWWKKRHRKRSMIQPKVVDCLARLLVPEGFVFLQTDVPDLADRMHACFSAHPRFQTSPAEIIQAQRMGSLRSHRELKCMEKGIPVHRLAYLLK